MCALAIGGASGQRMGTGGRESEKEGERGTGSGRGDHYDRRHGGLRAGGDGEEDTESGNIAGGIAGFDPPEERVDRVKPLTLYAGTVFVPMSTLLR